jgi:hypothetical protein
METRTIKDLRTITDIYIDLYGKSKELLISCIYFDNPNDNDAKNILHKWIFFRAVNYSFELALIIELCKLFQKNNSTQKYNINKFVNILTNNHKSLKYKDKIAIEIIKKWSDRLNCDETNNIIDYVVTLRDEIYAHTDNVDKYFQDKININFSKIEYLLFIIEDILIDIYFYVYESDLVLDKNSIIDFESIIKTVLEKNKYLEKFGDLSDY